MADGAKGLQSMAEGHGSIGTRTKEGCLGEFASASSTNEAVTLKGAPCPGTTASPSERMRATLRQVSTICFSVYPFVQ